MLLSLANHFAFFTMLLLLSNPISPLTTSNIDSPVKMQKQMHCVKSMFFNRGIDVQVARILKLVILKFQTI